MDGFFPVYFPCFYGCCISCKIIRPPNHLGACIFIKIVFYNILNPALGPLAEIDACILSFWFFVNMNKVVSSE